MASNNTEVKTTATTSSNTTTESSENKSLFSKAKDTLVNLKDQVKDMLSDENNNNNDEIIGMPKEKFEETKAELESALHFKQADEVQLQNQSGAEFQNQSGAEFQNLSGANMNMGYKEVNRQEFVQAPDVLLKQTEVVDDKQDEVKYSKLDQNETHVLPTLHVKEKPVIIEKEVEIEKPVEIKQTIIHKEKPIIAEKPIIIEKNEHYREATQHEKNHEKVVRETISEQDVGNQDQEALLNLRQERMNTFSDTAPIVKNEKHNVRLDTEFREQPTQINEKEVLYQQPVEIERTKVEKIIPTVHENVTLNKEHIYEKTAPEYHQESPQVVEKEKFYSQDTTANTAAFNADTVNTSRDNNDLYASNAAVDMARDEDQKRQIM